MATINTGLGGPQGVGEGSVRGSTLTSGNYDDGSLRVNITSVFGAGGINYFGTNYTSIFINTNGLISFSAPNLSYTPTALGGVTTPVIAPFWTDINITSGTATGTNNHRRAGQVTSTDDQIRCTGNTIIARHLHGARCLVVDAE